MYVSDILPGTVHEQISLDRKQNLKILIINKLFNAPMLMFEIRVYFKLYDYNILKFKVTRGNVLVKYDFIVFNLKPYNIYIESSMRQIISCIVCIASV